LYISRKGVKLAKQKEKNEQEEQRQQRRGMKVEEDGLFATAPFSLLTPVSVFLCAFA
jgi:hypothetical protein